MSTASTSPLTEQTSQPYPFKVHCSDERATAALVQSLARVFLQFILSQFHQHSGAPHLHISLQGDLGSGKTTAVRYLLKELGYTGKVKSPTYSLCEPHTLEIDGRQISLYHFDFYRMQSPSEWIEAGLQEHFVRQEPSICIVEWPEKASGTLPLMDLCIEITVNNSIGQENEHHRSVTFEAKTSTGKALLKNLVLTHQNQVPHS